MSVKKCPICSKCYLGEECYECGERKDVFLDEDADMPDVFKDIFNLNPRSVRKGKK